MTMLLRVILLLLTLASVLRAESITGAGKPVKWFNTDEGRRAADNTLSWQFDSGAFPKNIDTGRKSCPRSERDDYARSNWETIDNGATWTQLRILARAFRATSDAKYRDGFKRGLDYLLGAQYRSGGWPQRFPLAGGYHDYITFNDEAMVSVMRLLQDVAGESEFDFVDEAKRRRAAEAFDRGVQCILRCQIEVKGTKTAWCAQHDPVSFEPRPARSYEKVSISGGESAGIVDLLMSIDNPNAKVREAVIAACAWFEKSKITGIRVKQEKGDAIVVPDPQALPLWARFYDIKTNKPIFCGRDGKIKDELKDIEKERRGGYAWYGTWGLHLPDKLGKWKSKWNVHD